MMIGVELFALSSRLKSLIVLAGVAATPLAAAAQTIPAFSGAEGAAANVTGGRGGIVYHVTKLDRNANHNEPGTASVYGF